MGTKKQRRRWPIAILLLLIGCRQGNQFVPPPPPTVTVAHPIERPVSDTIEFVGTTKPTQVVDLRAQVKGYLEQILFDDGANVKAGQELFVIEQAPFILALDAAKAALEKAEASLALAESQYRRMAPLVKNGVVTQEELDVQKAQVATSKADVSAAQATVRNAEHDLGYTRIKAPIAGRIGRHLVDVGNLVQAQQTPLAEIQTIDPIYAEFSLSENDLLRFMAMLRKHELPDPEQNPPPLYLGLANEKGFPHVGKLDYRDLKINPSTGTTMRRAIFPNPGWQLIPGMFVRIQAAIGEPKPKVLVEERAISTDQRGDFLLVVNAKNVVEYRPVRLGIHSDDMRVIEEGIAASDRVVVNGLQRARPGAQVTPEIVETGKPSANTAKTASKKVEPKTVVEKAPAKTEKNGASK